MKSASQIINNESGVALIFALMMLLLLTVIGISALTNTDLETSIAGNHKAYKMTFYAADAGNEISKELIEQAIDGRWQNDATGTRPVGQVTVKEEAFWLKTDLGTTQPDSTNYDATLDFGRGSTYMVFGANTELSSGGAVQMAAGYEGVGKGAAGGGAQLIYDTRSLHEGVSRGRAQVKGQWRHLL